MFAGKRLDSPEESFSPIVSAAAVSVCALVYLLPFQKCQPLLTATCRISPVLLHCPIYMRSLWGLFPALPGVGGEAKFRNGVLRSRLAGPYTPTILALIWS